MDGGLTPQDSPRLAVYIICIIAAMWTFCLFARCRFTSSKLTGYIYATEDVFDMTTAHIRFSETAGADEQQPFCVAPEDRELVRSLAGSGKKVSVSVPAGLRLVPFWECAFPGEITILEEK